MVTEDDHTNRTDNSGEPQPAPRQYAPPSPQRIDESRRDLSSRSLKEFYSDAEFVEFLKQIELFVQQDDTSI